MLVISEYKIVRSKLRKEIYSSQGTVTGCKLYVSGQNLQLSTCNLKQTYTLHFIAIIGIFNF